MKINRTEQEIMKYWTARKNPVASICCTTYNHEKYISDAIDGFLIQETLFPFEIIIRDDCSTDNTANIIKTYVEKYPNIIKVIFETENQYSKGIRPMSVVFEKATGEYFALCEGDDYWTDPSKLQEQVTFLEKNPDHGLVHTEVDWLFDNSGEIQSNWHQNLNYHNNQGDIYELLIDTNIIVTCTVCVRKSLLDKYQSSDIFKMKFKMADYPMWLYISKISKIGYLDTSTTVRRILEESASNSKDMQNRWDFILTSYQIRETFMEAYPVSPETRNKVNIKFNRLKLSYGFLLINHAMAKESYSSLTKQKRITMTNRLYLFGSLNKITNIIGRILFRLSRDIGLPSPR